MNIVWGFGNRKHNLQLDFASKLVVIGSFMSQNFFTDRSNWNIFYESISVFHSINCIFDTGSLVIIILTKAHFYVFTTDSTEFPESTSL